MNLTSTLKLIDRRWPMDKIVRIFIISSIMCLTLIGNVYILIELCIRRQRQRTRLHYFIVNLAIGDLTIFACTMTSEMFLLIYDQEWILGNLACKLTLYIQVVTIASTTFINVAMTYDRYEAICCPFRTRQSTSRVRRIITICWIASFLVAIPQLFIFKQSLMSGSSTKYRCASTGYTAEWQRRVYFTIFTLYVLIIPVMCMTIWYARIIRVVTTSIKVWTQNLRGQTTAMSQTPLTSPARMKTAKLAMTIILVFVICWTPYMVVTLIEIYSDGRFHPPPWFDGVLQAISLLQSGLNPLIYLAFSQERKYPPILILAAASTLSQKSDRRHHRRRHRLGSISLCSRGETPPRKRMICSMVR